MASYILILICQYSKIVPIKQVQPKIFWRYYQHLECGSGYWIGFTTTVSDYHAHMYSLTKVSLCITYPLLHRRPPLALYSAFCLIISI